jgi:hypothetical protein
VAKYHWQLAALVVAEAFDYYVDPDLPTNWADAAADGVETPWYVQCYVTVLYIK